jgi:hypothetical protein
MAFATVKLNIGGLDSRAGGNPVFFGGGENFQETKAGCRPEFILGPVEGPA